MAGLGLELVNFIDSSNEANSEKLSTFTQSLFIYSE